ncbi:MAG: MaoC family dehydratase [Dehalococcoidales bacterium]|nr:MaoC family dehydratase [Dehalococcoidales bacterium]
MAGKRLADREIGEKYVCDEVRLITPTDLDMFCAMSGMRGDVFLSDEAAKTFGMKSRVVPGVMSVSIAFSLLGREFLQSAIFTGLNNLKLLAPVYTYDHLKVEAEVLAKKETSKGDRVFVTYTWTLKNQDGVAVLKGDNT